MITRQKEFSIGQLVEEPAVGLVMEDEGIDRRSLELMLGLMSHQTRRGGSLPHAPFVS